MKILETLGGVAESALNLSPTDDTIKEKELELQLLKMKQNRKEQEEKAEIPLPEKQKQPENKRPKPSKVGKTTYSVYLILPEQNTAHTTLDRFMTKNKDDAQVWFYLGYNKKTYLPEEIDGVGWGKTSAKDGFDGKLTRDGCNYIYLAPDGKLQMFEAGFTANAQKIIDDTEGMKMNDRAYEKTHYQIDKTYAHTDKTMLLFTTIILVFSVCLLAYFMFDGEIKIIGGINSAAQAAQNPNYMFPMNATDMGGNGTGVGQKFTGST